MSSNAKYQARGGAQDGFEELREITARGHHERQPLGLGMLSSYLDDLRLDIAVLGFYVKKNQISGKSVGRILPDHHSPLLT